MHMIICNDDTVKSFLFVKLYGESVTSRVNWIVFT